MNQTLQRNVELHHLSWILVLGAAPIALLLVLTLRSGLTDRPGLSPGGSRTTWAEAFRQAETAVGEGRMIKARDALAEAYRLARLDPGWEALLALGDLMREIQWDRQPGYYYGRLSVTARGAYLQAFHRANARGDWQGMLLAADRLEGLGDMPLAARLQALAWRKAKQDPQAMTRLAALRMPEEEWP